MRPTVSRLMLPFSQTAPPAAKLPLVSCHLVHPISITTARRAPATAAVPPCAAANAIAGAKPAAILAGIGRRPHKGKVDVNGLVEQFGVVGTVDGGAGFLEGWVLNQCVTLDKGTLAAADSIISRGLVHSRV